MSLEIADSINSSEPLKTHKITPAVIRLVVDRIVENLHPEKVIVFGSAARGDMKENSDLDIFVVMESNERLIDRRVIVSRLLRPRFFPMDIIVYTPEELRREIESQNPFVEEVMAQGKVFYERKPA